MVVDGGLGDEHGAKSGPTGSGDKSSLRPGPISAQAQSGRGGARQLNTTALPRLPLPATPLIRPRTLHL